ncbi:MAG: hypothetical protein ACRBBW_03790 [Cellvibrionaceae bacterium]
MSYPIWPAGFPHILRQGYTVSGQSSVRRIKMASGPDRVKRVSKTTIRGVSCSINLPDSLVEDFWTFYDVDAGAGSLWVLMPIKVGNVVAVHRCRFTNFPSTTPVSSFYSKINFTLETDQQISVPNLQLGNIEMSSYLLPSTSIATGETYKLEVGDETKPESDREPMSVTYARVHQITVESGSVKVFAAISDGGVKEYITISATDAEPTVPLFIAGVSKLHLEATEDSVVQVVGY